MAATRGPMASATPPAAPVPGPPAKMSAQQQRNRPKSDADWKNTCPWTYDELTQVQIEKARELCRIGDMYGVGLYPYDIPPHVEETPAEEVVMRLRCGDLRNAADIRDYAVLLEKGHIAPELHELNKAAGEVREFVYTTFREDVFRGAGGASPEDAPWPNPAGVGRAPVPAKDYKGRESAESAAHWKAHGHLHSF